MTKKWKTNQTMSNIHKPYINGKPKRPGTHQYHYLGPTIAVVARKLDPTVDQLCFHRNFQMVRNIQKGAMELSSDVPKMVGGRYGLAENGLKWSKSEEKSGDPRWPPPPLRRPYSGASGGGWPGNFIGVIVRRSCFPLVGACCRWLAGDASFGPKLHGSQMGQNDPTRCARFWRVFPRVLELKMVFWGLGFHLAPKVMFI